MSSTKSEGEARVGCVVALGGSAGSLDAFEQFLKAVPTEVSATFIVIHHMDPSQKTLLPELLARWTDMPVAIARTGEPLRTRHVYLREPGTVLEIHRGLFVTSPETPENRERYPIDLLFTSVAEEFGPSAIGVVVSGAGSDGTRGLRAIQREGGRTLAQRPEDARFPSMPESAIASGAADRTMSVAEIAAELSKFIECGARPVSETHDREAIDEICKVLNEKTGHDFSAYKKSTVARRIERRIQANGLRDLPAYLAFLRDHPPEPKALLRDLLIGVTQFFRDPQAFSAIRDTVIPALFDSAKKGEPIRIWVPACSTGEEAYSLAMLCLEHRETKRPSAEILVFATDIDRAALEIARDGVYPPSVADQIPRSLLAKYFTRNERGYRANQTLREVCIFSEHNLIKHPPFSKLDLISCRNLFIYWEPELQSRILPVFHYALNTGGYLFLGPAENVASSNELFRVVDKKFRIFQKTAGLSRSHLPFPITAPTSRSSLWGEDHGGRHIALGDKDASKSIVSALLEQHAPPAFVVTEQGEIAFYSGKTGRYVEPPTGAPSNNLFDLLDRRLRPETHALLHRAIKSKAPASLPISGYEREGTALRIDLSVRPLSDEEDAGLYLVVIAEKASTSEPTATAGSGSPSDGGNMVVQQLEEELRETREHLQNTIEEVKSSNEELLSMNEELQSANEELQTSKEELQSANEELETVNSELAKKVEELDASNSDLQNFFHSTQIPLLFLDRQLRIQKFTTATNRVFRLIPADVGRGIQDITASVKTSELIEDCRLVLDTLQTRELEMTSTDGSASYLVRIHPYRTQTNVIAGVVIAFSDVTELRRAQELQARLAAIVTSSNDAIVSKDLKSVVTSWNEAAERMFGYTAEEMIGSSIKRIIPEDRLHEEDLILSAISRGELIRHYETIRKRKDGSPIHVSVSISPLRNSAGKVVGASKIARDITEAKRIETALREAVRSRDEFLSIASHELKTPLTTLQMHAQMRQKALDRGDLSHFSEERLRKMSAMDSKQVTRLARLIDDMLDVTRIAAGRLSLSLEPVELGDLVAEMAERLEGQIEQAQCKLRIETVGKAEGRWDRSRIEQVVLNLLVNATKYGAGKPIEVGVATEGNRAVLRVRDHGIGIAPADHERIFRQFERAVSPDSVSGLGLGLYIVRQIVEAHGGTIRVESELDQGAEFIVTLPLS